MNACVWLYIYASVLRTASCCLSCSLTGSLTKDACKPQLAYSWALCMGGLAGAVYQVGAYKVLHWKYNTPTLCCCCCWDNECWMQFNVFRAISFARKVPLDAKSPGSPVQDGSACVHDCLEWDFVFLVAKISILPFVILYPVMTCSQPQQFKTSCRCNRL